MTVMKPDEIDRHRKVRDTFSIACGQCMGCRFTNKKHWAARTLHELQRPAYPGWDEGEPPPWGAGPCPASFVTLTYDGDSLPKDWSLKKKHLQNFGKKLRNQVGWVRYLAAGEYGDRYLRPHYHMCLVGIDWPDRYVCEVKNGKPVYSSRELEELWGHGFVQVGNLNWHTAAYVGGYVMKKLDNARAEQKYARLDEKGNWWVTPEYGTMSRRPGLGARWIREFYRDVYPGKPIMVNGIECSPPRYYDQEVKRLDPDLYEETRLARMAKVDEVANDVTRHTLEKAERIFKARFKAYQASKVDSEIS